MADELTEQLIINLQHSTNSYGLYLRRNGKDDPNLLEVKNLFKGFVDQSKILDSILHTKNEKNQNTAEQLEVIYNEEGRLNIEVLS